MAGGWWGRVALALALSGVVAGCRGPRPGVVPASDDHWLVVWAEDADRRHADFLAVLDRDGALVRTVPVKSAGNGPQGLAGEPRRDRLVFATGARTNRTFVFDLRAPRAAALVHVDDGGESRPLAGPRGVVTVPGGDVVVACADATGFRGEAREVLQSPGGVRVLAGDGRFERDVPARDKAARGFITAPAGVAVSPLLRRLATASEGHGFTPTARGELVPGMTVQLWSLAGPAFEKHVPLPVGPRGEENLAPRTPVFLRRTKALVVNAHQGGGIFFSDTLDLPHSFFKLVKDLGAGARPDGAAATPDDRFYVTALAGTGRVVSFALAAGGAMREVGQVAAGAPGAEGAPLAMSLDGRRIAVSDGRRVRRVQLDPGSGRLRLDGGFGAAAGGAPGVDFDRTEWPHGATGAARVRALLFVGDGG